jgi:hypothetical protein
MHALMVEKGFKMKPEDEVAQIKEKAERLFNHEVEARKQREERARKRAAEREAERLKNKEEGVETQNDNTREQMRNLFKEKDKVGERVIDNIDELPEEDQITKEQMRELKRRQWKEVQERRKAAEAGAEL